MTPFAQLEKIASTGAMAGSGTGAGLAAHSHNKAASEDTKERDDAAALRNRHILLALKRALQGAAIGGVTGAIATPEGGRPGGKTGALLGAAGGALLGGGVGAAEGGIKRSIGIDPLLQTIATARRP